MEAVACRLIVDVAHPGDMNMALDELLLAEVAAARRPALRFYRWSVPTLSLGYFQSARERDGHASSTGCALVRRPTGGGAIVHDAELTYSFVVPTAHPLARDAATLYRAVHGALIETLARWGIAAELATGAAARGTASEPFLCFERRAAGDVVLGGHKIAGSAQRRPGDAILQHGSVLLQASAAAPELPGINDLAGRAIDADELACGWSECLARSLGLAWETAPWTADELKAAAQIAIQKYAAGSWNLRR